MTNGPSLIAIETALVLIAVVVSFLWPQLRWDWCRVAERFFTPLARRRGLAVLAVGLTAGVVRLALLPVSPIPEPFIHDEFSYLVAADTFASGRVTNPTHPMWRYFETFHVTQVPSYMSMYFPGQGLVLAAGKVLGGHPWYGVWLSAALMCSAICWMLQGWLPPGWALLGGALAVMRLGLFSYWTNMYYGGAVAATGGALLLGALPRILQKATVWRTTLMAMGVALLAVTRPYEGLLLCIPAGAFLVWQMGRKYGLRLKLFGPKVLAPAALLLLTFSLMGYYNYRVFGNSFTLPYQVNRATYAVAPVFLWQSRQPAPEYRYKVMRDFYTGWELDDFLYAKTIKGFVARTAQKAGVVTIFFFGAALLPPLVMLRRLFHDTRIRFLLVAGCVYAVGLVANAWLFPHYVAPFSCALYAILLQCMRHLRSGSPGGVFLVRAIPVICLVLVGIRVCAEPLHVSLGHWPTVSVWYGMDPVGLQRARIDRELHGRAGKQLVIVRYSAGHVPFDDWVYNAADIDSAKVVWAREPDGGKAPLDLLHFFRDREVWLVEPDASPPRLSPYPLRDADLLATTRPEPK